MRWKTKQEKAAGQGSLLLNEVAVAADCLTKEHYPVHVTASVSFRIDDPAVAKRARRVPGAQDEMSAQAHDIVVRNLRSAMESFAWDEMLSHRLRPIEQIRATSGPEMSALGLRIDSFAFRTIDFPDDSEPSIILRAAGDRVRREMREAALPAEAATEAGTTDREAQA